MNNQQEAEGKKIIFNNDFNNAIKKLKILQDKRLTKELNFLEEKLNVKERIPYFVVSSESLYKLVLFGEKLRKNVVILEEHIGVETSIALYPFTEVLSSLLSISLMLEKAGYDFKVKDTIEENLRDFSYMNNLYFNGTDDNAKTKYNPITRLSPLRTASYFIDQVVALFNVFMINILDENSEVHDTTAKAAELYLATERSIKIMFILFANLYNNKVNSIDSFSIAQLFLFSFVGNIINCNITDLIDKDYVDCILQDEYSLIRNREFTADLEENIFMEIYAEQEYWIKKIMESDDILEVNVDAIIKLLSKELENAEIRTGVQIMNNKTNIGEEDGK